MVGREEIKLRANRRACGGAEPITERHTNLKPILDEKLNIENAKTIESTLQKR
jgi:hypothetical protein